MIKKTLIYFNLLLLVGFVYQLNTLYRQVNNVPEHQLTLPVFDFTALHRPVVEKNGSYARLFGDIPPTMTGTVKGRGGSLEQLQVGKDLIRVKGIFVKNNQRTAVLEILSVGSKKAKQQPLRRMVIGDTLSGYVLTAVTPGSITLSHPDHGAVTLELFDSDKNSF